ncbi:transcription initiation at TATA-containing promoter protein [Saxophila tyrrhenica]|uniref:Transcription initiation at TATA-containing promoter protein n=1 Tax=Saxophila tyrrhenica TaxID=1690608 RepID=A0AAV9PRE9_9PEZI|nr:transcription initiation at TATA-containing promoter protein [Saxophila tyrrhenica]
MSSDLSAHLPPADDMDSSVAQQPYEAAAVNGEQQPDIDPATADPADSAIDAPTDAPVGPTDAAMDAKVTALRPADLNPSGPSPVDDVSSGIQPVADFLPSKDSTHLSHPTPPPDEPLTTGAADVEMAGMAGDAQSPVADTRSMSAQPEQGLVRPREDEGEDERAAKRSKLDDDVVMESTSGMAAPPTTEPVDAVTASVMKTVDEPGMDATRASTREPSPQTVPILQPTGEPQATEPPAIASDPTAPPDTAPPSEDVKVEATQPTTQQPASDVLDAPSETVDSGNAMVADTQPDVKPPDQVTASDSQAPPPSATQPAPDSAGKPTYSTEAMTPAQRSFLLEKVKNLKKTKNSGPFAKPVDPVALNIPNYLTIIEKPMDLSTLETNLKKGEYNSVQAFADDFDMIISNTRRFNGDAHAVTQIGFNLEAYFRKAMETVPSAQMAAPSKPEKKRSVSIPREPPPRRESRQVAPPAAPAPPAGQGADTYALQADGTPQIRRQSSNRPARAIKPPANREIPYAKPKRKAHQLELRFCDWILHEISSSKYGNLNHPFQAPVDPVALNIPHYRQVIKHPMDLGTMMQKLKNGEYSTAAEVKKDFELIISNCTSFNPPGNPIRDMAIGLRREFETLWAQKEKWERKNQPISNRASSASADDESVVDDDEEDEEDDKKTATIKALQKQLADMQNALSGLGSADGGKASKKKAKASKSGSKKVGSMSAAPKAKSAAKPAAKSKKTRTVTYEDKQEISEAVPKMDESQVSELTRIITTNSAKHREMGDEMELEIDDLPNDVQIMLLDFVRRIFGNPKKKAREMSPDDAAALDDDDFEPARRGSGAAGKRKKHKPMGKVEQQNAIDKLRGKLAQFNGATSGSESPTNSSFAVAKEEVESSGDEESEESEEE